MSTKLGDQGLMVLRSEGSYPVILTDIDAPEMTKSASGAFCRVRIRYSDGQTGIVFVAGYYAMADMLYRSREFWKKQKNLSVTVNHVIRDRMVYLDARLVFPK